MNRIKISENFYLDEFEDKRAGGVVKIDERLVEVLQEIRTRIRKPIKITSGFRTEKSHIEIYKEIYGQFWEEHIAWHSKHLQGKAVDIKIIGGNYIDYMNVINFAKQSGIIKGIGDGVEAKGFIHLDSRDSDKIIEWKY